MISSWHRRTSPERLHAHMIFRYVSWAFSEQKGGLEDGVLPR